MSDCCDVCIIGSGAGGGPIALALAQAGYDVVVIDKGPWLSEGDFFKDEIAAGRRNAYIPSLREQPHTVETETAECKWQVRPTHNSGWNFHNGSCVGGSTNFMSGFFHRLKPFDFKLLSTFGPIKDANVVDWPISYEDFEGYYDKVEREVGVSGRAVAHTFAEPRSSNDFPYPPTLEHPLAHWIDKACSKLGLNSVPTPRAILSTPRGNRSSCSYNGYCGGFGCATGAKGSSRASLLMRAVETGHCQIRPNCMASRLESDHLGKVVGVKYFDESGNLKSISARRYVLACQAIETARLLLLSTGPRHPHGLGNLNRLVGKNLLFAGGGASFGIFKYADFPAKEAEELRVFGPFINRTVEDYYVLEKDDKGASQKGGIIDFIFRSTAAIARASQLIEGDNGLVWGRELKAKLYSHFHEGVYVKVEAFSDWLPTNNCFVALDPQVKDKWGLPVARVRVGLHKHNLTIGWHLAKKGAEILEHLGAKQVQFFASGSPPTNLQAGTCRFGDDPATSVLDKDCRMHEARDVYVSDGSFMPTGGSAPYTWTIYANAFRIADAIIADLGQR